MDTRRKACQRIKPSPKVLAPCAPGLVASKTLMMPSNRSCASWGPSFAQNTDSTRLHWSSEPTVGRHHWTHRNTTSTPPRVLTTLPGSSSSTSGTNPPTAPPPRRTAGSSGGYPSRGASDTASRAKNSGGSSVVGWIINGSVYDKIDQQFVNEILQ